MVVINLHHRLGNRVAEGVGSKPYGLALPPCARSELADSHSFGGPDSPAQSTTPVTLRMNEGQEKQIRNPTSVSATGQSTLSSFIRLIDLAPSRADFSSSATAFGILIGFGDAYTLTLYLVSADTYASSQNRDKSVRPSGHFTFGLPS